MALSVVAFAGVVEGLRRGARPLYLASALPAGLLPWMMVHAAPVALSLAVLAGWGLRAGRRPGRWWWEWLAVAALPSLAVAGAYFWWGPFDVFVRTVFLAPFGVMGGGLESGYRFFSGEELRHLLVTAPWTPLYVLVLAAGAAWLPGAVREAPPGERLARLALSRPSPRGGIRSHRHRETAGPARVLDRRGPGGGPARRHRAREKPGVVGMDPAERGPSRPAVHPAGLPDALSRSGADPADRSLEEGAETAAAGRGVLWRGGALGRAHRPPGDPARPQRALRIQGARFGSEAASALHLRAPVVPAAPLRLGRGGPHGRRLGRGRGHAPRPGSGARIGGGGDPFRPPAGARGPETGVGGVFLPRMAAGVVPADGGLRRRRSPVESRHPGPPRRLSPGGAAVAPGSLGHRGRPSRRNGRPSLESGQPSRATGQPSRRSGRPSRTDGRPSRRSGRPHLRRQRRTGGRRPGKAGTPKARDHSGGAPHRDAPPAPRRWPAPGVLRHPHLQRGAQRHASAATPERPVRRRGRHVPDRRRPEPGRHRRPGPRVRRDPPPGAPPRRPATRPGGRLLTRLRPCPRHPRRGRDRADGRGLLARSRGRAKTAPAARGGLRRGHRKPLRRRRLDRRALAPRPPAAVPVGQSSHPPGRRHRGRPAPRGSRPSGPRRSGPRIPPGST